MPVIKKPLNLDLGTTYLRAVRTKKGRDEVVGEFIPLGVACHNESYQATVVYRKADNPDPMGWLNCTLTHWNLHFKPKPSPTAEKTLDVTAKGPEY